MPRFLTPATGWMLCSSAAFSLMSTLVRLLSQTAALSAGQIVCLRCALTLVLLLPALLLSRFDLLRTQRLSGHVGRGLIGSVGMFLWTYSLTILPVTQATALSFTAPLLTSLFAVIFLHERISARQWGLLLVGFFGTLVILRPGTQHFDWHALIVIAAATNWAMVGLFIKTLSRTERPLTMIFYMNLIMGATALPFALLHWQPVSLAAWGWLGAIALCSLAMHYTLVRAYALASVAALMPYDFTRLIFTAIIAYLLFAEVSDHTTWWGAAIIIIAAALSARSHRPPSEAAAQA